MNRQVEIKVRLPEAKKVRFDQHCDSLGVSRNSRLETIIDADLEGRIAQDQVAPKARDPLSEAELRKSEFLELSHLLSCESETYRTTIDDRLKVLGSLASVKQMNDGFGELSTKHDVVKTALEEQKQVLTQQATKADGEFAAIKSSLRIERPGWLRNPLVWSGALASVLMVAFLVSVLPGSSWPMRALARHALGEDDPVIAAAKLAGDGADFKEATIRETLVMSRDSRFARSYLTCLARARVSHRRTRCAVDFPSIY